MANKEWFKSVIVYLCVSFFILTLVFIYMSLRGKPQAGLIEVSCSATLFVIFLHITKRALPQSSTIISSVLSILMAIILIYVNYFLQIKENKNYSFREILVGDLLARKFVGNEYIKTLKSPVDDFKDNGEKVEFSQTRTEKHTIESSFEKPEKTVISYNQTKLTLDDAYKAPIKNVIALPVNLLLDTVVHKLKYKEKELELPAPHKAEALMENVEDLLTKASVLSQPFCESFNLPAEIGH